MADNTQTNSTTSTSTPVNPQGDIVVDKNKSADQYMKDAEAKYIIPNMIRDKFPDLVKLIYETESMNTEEREYWMQIMPIMTEEQISKFRDILVNEKNELSKLDSEYSNEMNKLNQKKSQEIDEKALKQKIETIKVQEEKQETKEKGQEEDLLNQLNNL